MNNFTYIFVVCLLALGIIYFHFQNKTVEGYNNHTGQFCYSCVGKTMNQCLGCFNCGFCVDAYGNSGCIGGDKNGPYNYERCALWYYTDPYAKMEQRNQNYRCNSGPRSSNRVIGV